MLACRQERSGIEEAFLALTGDGHDRRRVRRGRQAARVRPPRLEDRALLPRRVRRRHARARHPDLRLLVHRQARRPGQAADVRRHASRATWRSSPPGSWSTSPLGVLLYQVAGRAAQEQLTGTSRHCSPRRPRRHAAVRLGRLHADARPDPRRVPARRDRPRCSASTSSPAASGRRSRCMPRSCRSPGASGCIGAAVVVRSAAAASATGVVVTLLGLISGAVFPIALLPAGSCCRRVEPVRDRDRGCARRADRRHRLGPRRVDMLRLLPLSALASRSACSASAGRSRASAAAARWGLLMDLWDRVGELADRAPRLSDLRHHKLHLLAASRMRARGEAVPAELRGRGASRGRRLALAGRAAAPRPCRQRRADHRHEGPRGRRALAAGPRCGRGRTSTCWSPTPHGLQRALLAAGFVEIGDPALYEDIHHLRPLMAPGLPLTIEIHLRPKWPEGTRAPTFGELFDGGAPGRVRERSRRAGPLGRPPRGPARRPRMGHNPLRLRRPPRTSPRWRSRPAGRGRRGRPPVGRQRLWATTPARSTSPARRAAARAIWRRHLHGRASAPCSRATSSASSARSRPAAHRRGAGARSPALAGRRRRPASAGRTKCRRAGDGAPCATLATTVVSTQPPERRRR